VTTALVKYVFVDVVGFTRDRSVEAQTDIVARLNEVARASVRQHTRGLHGTVYLPTGDGLCIAIIDSRALFDVHLSVGLDMLRRIAAHNQRISDASRRFEIRVGVAENVDNLLMDINGNRNVAGAGINTAQRVMSVGDGGQILASQNVFEALRHRERFQNSFRSLAAVAKHGLRLPVHQFIEEGHAGLSIALPSAFRTTVPPLSRFEGFLLAHALKHEPFFAAKAARGLIRSAGNILLYFLACDSEGLATETPAHPYNLKVHNAGRASLEEQFTYYMGLDFDVSFSLSEALLARLSHQSRCFREAGFLAFVSDVGKATLYAAFPEIWREFTLGDPPN
jgi:class 3 adenylate cyclase